jgi:hypothetical protein
VNPRVLLSHVLLESERDSLKDDAHPRETGLGPLSRLAPRFREVDLTGQSVSDSTQWRGAQVRVRARRFRPVYLQNSQALSHLGWSYATKIPALNPGHEPNPRLPSFEREEDQPRTAVCASSGLLPNRTGIKYTASKRTISLQGPAFHQDLLHLRYRRPAEAVKLMRALVPPD